MTLLDHLTWGEKTISCKGQDFRDSIDMLAKTDKEPAFFMAYKKETSHSSRLLFFFIFRIFSVKFWKF